MIEYIARDAARPDAFCIGVSCQDCPFLKSPLYGGCRIDDFIASIPTADVLPVRRGKWIVRDNPGTGWYRVNCSECGEDFTSVIPVIGFFQNAKPTWEYCPNCGAKMDGE